MCVLFCEVIELRVSSLLWWCVGVVGGGVVVAGRGGDGGGVWGGGGVVNTGRSMRSSALAAIFNLFRETAA